MVVNSWTKNSAIENLVKISFFGLVKKISDWKTQQNCLNYSWKIFRWFNFSEKTEHLELLISKN